MQINVGEDEEKLLNTNMLFWTNMTQKIPVTIITITNLYANQIKYFSSPKQLHYGL